MVVTERYPDNPILKPDERHDWEDLAVLNWCPVEYQKKIHVLYRAISKKKKIHDVEFNVSTIGHAISDDGRHFNNRRQFITPEYDWEKYGCEDPRVTKVGSKFYIFYTALSKYPFTADGIRVGLAITRDFHKIEKNVR